MLQALLQVYKSVKTLQNQWPNDDPKLAVLMKKIFVSGAIILLL